MGKFIDNALFQPTKFVGTVYEKISHITSKFSNVNQYMSCQVIVQEVLPVRFSAMYSFLSYRSWNAHRLERLGLMTYNTNP